MQIDCFSCGSVAHYTCPGCKRPFCPKCFRVVGIDAVNFLHEVVIDYFECESCGRVPSDIHVPHIPFWSQPSETK